MNVVEIRNLRKSYPGFDLKADLTLPAGTVMGLVGENGAGKTTMIKLLLGASKCDEGSIRIFDTENIDSATIKERIGVVMDGCFFPETLNVKQIGKIMSCFYSKWDKEKYEQYLNHFDIPKNKLIKHFSKGMRMKLAILCALSHDAELLVLDEPTSGLDPVVRNEILDLFREFIQDEGHTILISSHITSDLEHIADEIAFIHQGRIVLNETYEALCSNYGILRCDQSFFKQMDKEYIISWKQNPYSYDVLLKDAVDFLKQYPDAVVDRGSLEEILLLIVKGEKK